MATFLDHPVKSWINVIPIIEQRSVFKQEASRTYCSSDSSLVTAHYKLSFIIIIYSLIATHWKHVQWFATMHVYICASIYKAPSYWCSELWQRFYAGETLDNTRSMRSIYCILLVFVESIVGKFTHASISSSPADLAVSKVWKRKQSAYLVYNREVFAQSY